MGPLSSVQWYMTECTLTSNLLETWQMIWDVPFKLGNCIKICLSLRWKCLPTILYPSCLWVIHSYWPDCKTETFLLIKLSSDQEVWRHSRLFKVLISMSHLEMEVLSTCQFKNFWTNLISYRLIKMFTSQSLRKAWQK